MDSSDDRRVSLISSRSNDSGRQLHNAERANQVQTESVDEVDNFIFDDSFTSRTSPKWTKPLLLQDDLRVRGNRLSNYQGPHLSKSEPGFVGVWKDWWWEVLCGFLAVGSLISITAILFPYDGRPLPIWPYNLSINSIISIFVVIMKASMYLVLSQGKRLICVQIGSCLVHGSNLK